ncbi:MAG: sigma-70 family RNA polymerase sigma factor [Pseudomonadota bacterium]
MPIGKPDVGLASFIDEREDLLALAHSVVGSRAIAEDVVQESWIRWHGRSYPTDRARPLLRRIVANLARDWYRRARTERNINQYIADEVELYPDSERVIIARQELRLVVDALRELPERTLVAFRLSRIEGRSLTEIGALLGVSTPRAHQLVRGALVHVAKRLDGDASS